MRCPNCGYENTDGKFCTECGAKIIQDNYGLNNNFQAIQKSNNCNEVSRKKNSTLSIWALALSIIPFTSFIGLLLVIIDLCINSKKKKTLTTIAFIISSIWILLGIAYFLLSNDTNSHANSSTNIYDTSVNKNEEKEFNIDDNLHAGDSYEYDGLRVTVNSVTADFQDYDKDWFSPKDGYKYVAANLTYENTGSNDQKYASIYDYECYADNSLCEAEYGLDNSNFINANISNGRNVTFTVYFQVPEDAQSIELEYNDSSLWSNLDTNIKIIIQ